MQNQINLDMYESNQFSEIKALEKEKRDILNRLQIVQRELLEATKDARSVPISESGNIKLCRLSSGEYFIHETSGFGVAATQRITAGVKLDLMQKALDYFKKEPGNG